MWVLIFNFIFLWGHLLFSELLLRYRTSLFMCRSSQTLLPVCDEQFGKSGALVSLVMLTVGGETQTGSISINFSMALAQKRLGWEIASVLSRQNVLCWFLFVVYQ